MIEMVDKKLPSFTNKVQEEDYKQVDTTNISFSYLDILRRKASNNTMR